jgi:hypothetical protein
MFEDKDEQWKKRRLWRTAEELPPHVFEALHKPDCAINPIAVVATTDPDGAPRTAPFGSLRAVTPRLLGLGCDRRHDTYANLCRDDRVTIAFLAPPEVAVSVLGRARVVREPMLCDEQKAMLEIDITAVKNDLGLVISIERGTELVIPEEQIGFYLAVVEEVEKG